MPEDYRNNSRNVYEPTEINVDGINYILYKFKFSGIRDFYDFLKSNPKINTEIWSDPGDIASTKKDYDFSGVPYNEALEKLIGDVDPGYQEYLKIQRIIQAKERQVHKYKEIKSVSGGIINPVDYITSSPTIYRTSRLIKQPKFITIDTQVAYRWTTSKEQVFNRALIITNLIRALEREGYKVNLNSFMLAANDYELIEAIFELKKNNQSINYQALYKSLVDVEFFRRLCFRIMEVSNVKTGWNYGYGTTCNKYLSTQVLKLKKDDIYFDQPCAMDIEGYNIATDFENVISILGLDNVIDVEREKHILNESVKVLKR